jgi:hypothetical protein
VRHVEHDRLEEQHERHPFCKNINDLPISFLDV